ncbi:hypothetical protein Vretimale_13750 [Volvox reticuliferus]|uniref:tRNA-uridine aminocarboxypropyltransferase n=1 Tax=Volvox reticuliferus TaxID=1737510 RepID=A0A8J4GMZ3_9CHLO|nr:hypothetical protein Vretimale_13750 [Volvox reticuliferus]
MRLLGRILILQHPHELKKRLATVPLLKCCLDDESMTVITGRKLQQPGSNAVVDALLEGAERGTYPLYVLFPGPGSYDLASLAEGPTHGNALLRAAGRAMAVGPHPCASISLSAPKVSSPSPLLLSAAAAPQTTAADTAVTQAGVKEADQIRLPVSELAPLKPAGSPPAGPQQQEQNSQTQGQELQLLDPTETAHPAREPAPKLNSPEQSSPLGASAPGTASGVPSCCTRSDGATRNLGQVPVGVRNVESAPEPVTEVMVTGSNWKPAADASGGGECHSLEMQLSPPAYLLLVIDGTWRQAREMYRVVAPRCLPPGGPGIQVALKPSDVLPASVLLQRHRQQKPQNAELELAGKTEAEAEAGGSRPGDDDSGLEPGADYDPEMPCLIRKEPMEGFVTTYEATARAIGLLERDAAIGSELLAPLRLMTRLQASFSPSVRSRMRGEPEPPTEPSRT